jgi:hypothetical protein
LPDALEEVVRNKNQLLIFHDSRTNGITVSTYKSRVFDLELKEGLPTGIIVTQRQVVTAAVSKAVSQD